MNPLLAQFGMTVEDRDALEIQNIELNFPAIVPGRVAHIDADFLSYQFSAETKDQLDGIKPRATFEEMCESAKWGLYMLQRQVGAESYVAHITPKGSDKGGREDFAMTKPYQANRANKVQPEHLHRLRNFIGDLPGSIVNLHQEADDSLTQANVAAREAGESNLSVIISADKDLRMAPGLHWCFHDEKLISVYGTFGHTYLESHLLPSGKMSSKKCLGWGTKFFWAQMLMGDTADNIAGLPRIDGGLVFERTGRGNAKQKPRLCGAVAAHELLEGFETDKECLEFVMEAYRSSPHEWRDYRTDEPISWGAAMLGDARTLWMRRYDDPYDVDKWMREIYSE